MEVTLPGMLASNTEVYNNNNSKMKSSITPGRIPELCSLLNLDFYKDIIATDLQVASSRCSNIGNETAERMPPAHRDLTMPWVLSIYSNVWLNYAAWKMCMIIVSNNYLQYMYRYLQIHHMEILNITSPTETNNGPVKSKAN